MKATQEEIREYLRIFLGARGLELPDGVVWWCDSNEEECSASLELYIKVVWTPHGKVKSVTGKSVDRWFGSQPKNPIKSKEGLL